MKLNDYNTADLPLNDVAELLASVNQETLKKGTQLMDKKCVSNLQIRANKITADVRGSYIYQVQFSFKPELRCDCTCPAADYMDICKHAVVVALQLTQPDKVPEEDQNEQLLRRYFKQKQPDELISLLLELLRGNESLAKAWLFEATLASEPPSLAQLKKMVTKAMPARALWNWHEVSGYFSAAEAQLGSIWTAMEKLPVAEQWLLTEHVLKRLNNVLGRIDDSGGYRFAIEGQLFEKMPAIFEKLDWSAAKKAQWLFEHLNQTEYDVFPEVLQYFPCIGEVKNCLLKLCNDAVETMATELLRVDQPFELAWQMKSYARPLLEAAQQSGNWREEVRLLSMLAYRCDDFLELSKLCLGHQEELDAEDWLLRAKKVAEHQHEERACAHQEVRVKMAFGEHQQAWQAAWRGFEQHPSYHEYQYLLTVHEQLGHLEPQLLTKVEQVLINAPSQQRDLVDFYLANHELEKARACIRSGGGSREQVLQLADLSVAKQPAEALAIYQRVVKKLIEQGNAPSYEQAAQLLLQLQAQLKANQHPLSDFNHSVAQLATEFRRKRNMLALLNTHFADCF